MIPAVVLSSHNMGLGVIRALGLMGVPVTVFYYEKIDMGYVSKYVRESIFTAHPERFEYQFIDSLMEYAGNNGRCLLIPADDATLSAVSRNKSRLELNYIVACTEWVVTERFLNKKYTYMLAESLGVPAPKTIFPGSLSDIEQSNEIIEYPIILKPYLSHLYYDMFKKKAVRVENYVQLKLAYQEASSRGIEVMVQELIPGGDSEGVNYNSYFHNGEPLIDFTSEKVRLSPPELGVPCVVVSKEIQEVIEPACKILRAMNFYGYSCVEFKRDYRDNAYKLMEVNGRYNRSGLLSVRCGINFPWFQYRHLVNNELPTKCSYKTGVYWIDEFRDIRDLPKNLLKMKYSVINYFRPYFNQHIFAVFDIRDIRTFLKRCSDIFVMGLQLIYSYFRSLLLRFQRSASERS